MTRSGRRPDEDAPQVTSSRHDTAIDRPEPHDADQKPDTAKAVSAPTGAIAGAIAGGAAGIAIPALGPIGAAVGAIIGALGGTAVGTAASEAGDDLYTATHDAHYQSIWENSADRPADRTFDSVRPAFQFGHIAAGHPVYGGRHFGEVAGDLQLRWPDDLRSKVGEWGAISRFVEEAYSHARSQGVGEQRDRGVIGTGGSAVNPAERDRAEGRG